MYIMKQFLLLILLALTAMPTDAQEYPKVILPGDYPDPSIMREGEDYYMTHSPFFYAPGFLIWHSKDLVNWEPVCRACPEYEGSAMAPDLLKYKDKYSHIQLLYFQRRKLRHLCRQHPRSVE